MGLHGARRQEQPCGYACVPESFGDKAEDLGLARGHRGAPRLGRQVPLRGCPSLEGHPGRAQQDPVIVEFSAEDVERYQLLSQRTLPDFEPSPGSHALAVEVFEQMRAASLRPG